MIQASLTFEPLDENTDNAETAKRYKEIKDELGFLSILYTYLGHSEGQRLKL